MKFVSISSITKCMVLIFAFAKPGDAVNNLDLIEEILQQDMKIKPEQTVQDLHPDIYGDSFVDPDPGECFNGDVGNGNVIDIHQDAVYHIVREYFNANPSTIEYIEQSQVRERVQAVVQNLKEIVKLVRKCIADGSKTSYGLTSMAIYTDEEFRRNFLTKVPDFEKSNTPGYSDKNGICDVNLRPNEVLPTDLDYLEQGYVTPAKDQGKDFHGQDVKCGSCYVFSTTAALESQHLLRVAKSPAVDYSEQATLNCMQNKCGGGAFFEPIGHFIKHGVTDQKNFPYLGKDEPCNLNYPRVEFADAICQHLNLTESQIKTLLNRIGPVAIFVVAPNGIQHLKSIIFDTDCDTDESQAHGVLLYGWSSQNKAWLLKNSWGKNWGKEGFYSLPQGKDACRINHYLSVPIISREHDRDVNGYGGEDKVLSYN